MFYIVLVFFFFFKQKTAYEMRISDWSSDVCSSDLEEDSIEMVNLSPPRRSEVVNTAETTKYGKLFKEIGQYKSAYNIPDVSGATIQLKNLSFEVSKLKIGRASCRAGVGRYV